MAGFKAVERRAQYLRRDSGGFAIAIRILAFEAF
jgi:hypothetical protein